MRHFLKKFLSKIRNNILPLEAIDLNRPVSIQKILWDEARHESANFCRPYLNGALLFDDEDQLRKYVFSKIPKEGIILEFGVYQAHSINLFAQHSKFQDDKRPLHGFDNFEGLEEEWFGHFSAAEDFNLKGCIPLVEDNVKLHKGWIKDTLPEFLTVNPERIAFVHIDTDTYTPAKLILELLNERLVEGSVILFDEFFGYPNWQNGEFRAFKKLLSNRKIEFIAFGSEQAAIRINE